MNASTKGIAMTTRDLLEQQMLDMREDMREIRTSMTDIAKAITKFAVLEEKHQTSAAAIERMTLKLEKVEDKVSDLELKQTQMIAAAQGASWVAKIMWAVGGGGFLTVAGAVAVQAIKVFK